MSEPMSIELNAALESLFALPNWENRGDQGDCRKALALVYDNFKKHKKLQQAGIGKMTPIEVPMTDELAKKLDFINKDAYANAKLLLAIDDSTPGQRSLIDTMIVRLVNLEQMVLDMKRNVDRFFE